MKEHIAKQWVEALRSDRYKQTAALLRTATGFCCLGVLCDISGVGGWVGKEYANGDNEVVTQWEYLTAHDGGATILPYSIQNYGGMASDNGETVTETGLNANALSLAEMNDNGMSFAEIADYIEQNWEKL